MRQQGIKCSRCEEWTHARCGVVSREEYVRLGERVDEPWLCRECRGVVVLSLRCMYQTK